MIFMVTLVKAQLNTNCFVLMLSVDIDICKGEYYYIFLTRV